MINDILHNRRHFADIRSIYNGRNRRLTLLLLVAVSYNSLLLSFLFPTYISSRFPFRYAATGFFKSFFYSAVNSLFFVLVPSGCFFYRQNAQVVKRGISTQTNAKTSQCEPASTVSIARAQMCIVSRNKPNC